MIDVDKCVKEYTDGFERGTKREVFRNGYGYGKFFELYMETEGE